MRERERHERTKREGEEGSETDREKRGVEGGRESARFFFFFYETHVQGRLVH